MAASESRGNVRCVHCDKVLVKKNLVEVEFVSVLSKDIRNIFGPKPTKIAKTVDDYTSSEDSILPSSDYFGDSSTSSHADRGLGLTEKDDNTECILSQLQALHLKIDRLEK